MLDKIIFLSFILNITGLASFLAVLLHVPLAVLSMTFIFIHIFYICKRSNYIIYVFKEKALIAWLFILLIWPYFTLIYTMTPDYREVGVQLMYISLFLSAIIFTISNGLKHVCLILLLSLFITIIGLYLSAIYIPLFMGVALLVNKNPDLYTRPFGFLLEPNSLGICIAFLWTSMHILQQKRNSIILDIAILFLAFISIILTGSRGASLIFLVVIILIYISEMKIYSNKSNILMITLLFLMIFSSFLLLKHIQPIVDSINPQYSDLANRLDSMLSAKSLLDDESVVSRRDAQDDYIDLIKDKLLLGYGIGSENYFVKKDKISTVAHSDMYSLAFSYGIAYPIFLTILLINMYLASRKKNRIYKISTINIASFIVFTLISISIANLLTLRLSYIILGFVFSIAYYPKFVLRQT